MLSNRATDREDLGGLALKVAEEFEKLLGGQHPNRAVVDEFSAFLAGGRDAPLPAAPVFLHNHKTIGAFSRAWQRAYHSGIETVEDLNVRVREKVEEAKELLGQPEGTREAD